MSDANLDALMAAALADALTPESKERALNEITRLRTALSASEERARGLERERDEAREREKNWRDFCLRHPEILPPEPARHIGELEAALAARESSLSEERAKREEAEALAEVGRLWKKEGNEAIDARNEALLDLAASRAEVQALTAALEQAEIARARAWNEGVKDERVRAEAESARLTAENERLTRERDEAQAYAHQAYTDLSVEADNADTMAIMLLRGATPPPGTEAASTGGPRCDDRPDRKASLTAPPLMEGALARWPIDTVLERLAAAADLERVREATREAQEIVTGWRRLYTGEEGVWGDEGRRALHLSAMNIERRILPPLRALATPGAEAASTGTVLTEQQKSALAPFLRCVGTMKEAAKEPRLVTDFGRFEREIGDAEVLALHAAFRRLMTFTEVHGPQRAAASTGTGEGKEDGR